MGLLVRDDKKQIVVINTNVCYVRLFFNLFIFYFKEFGLGSADCHLLHSKVGYCCWSLLCRYPAKSLISNVAAYINQHNGSPGIFYCASFRVAHPRRIGANAQTRIEWTGLRSSNPIEGLTDPLTIIYSIYQSIWENQHLVADAHFVDRMPPFYHGCLERF